MSNKILLDSNGYNRGVYVGRAAISYPFLSNGDRVSCIIKRQYRIRQSAYQPPQIGVAKDPQIPAAYLVFESEPTPTGIADILAVEHTFARIPTTQTVDGTISITKPSPNLETYPGTVGDYRVFKPDTSLDRFDAYERKTVTSDTGAPSSFRPDGGTATASFDGGTTAATAHNATISTWETNIDALTPVTNRGGCAVTGSPISTGDLTVTFANYAAATSNTGSLTGDTGSTISGTVTTSNGGYTQAIVIAPGPIDDAAAALDLTNVTATGGSWIETIQQTSANLIRLEFLRSGGTIDGGTFTMEFYGQVTGAIGINADAATVQAAVDAACSTLLARGTVVCSGVVPVLSGGGDGRAVSITVTPRITGGTHTITIFGQTTASLNHNDSLATIEAALDALSEVTTNRGGCTVTGVGYDGAKIQISVNFTNPLFTLDTASLTPAGCIATITSMDGGINRVQKISVVAPNATRTFYISDGHEIAIGDTIMIRSAAADYSEIAGVFSVPDPYTLILTVSPDDTYAAAATITEVGRRTKADYEPGADPSVPCDIVTRFSLSAITPETYQGSDAALLQAIFAADTTINYLVGDASRWPTSDSPIRSMTTTQISADNL